MSCPHCGEIKRLYKANGEVICYNCATPIILDKCPRCGAEGNEMWYECGSSVRWHWQSDKCLIKCLKAQVAEAKKIFESVDKVTLGPTLFNVSPLSIRRSITTWRKNVAK